MPHPTANTAVNRRSTLIPQLIAICRLSTAARTCAPRFDRSNTSTSRTVIAPPTSRRNRRYELTSNRPTDTLHQRDDEVAPEHHDRSMRQIGESHQAHRDRQSACDQEQHDSIGNAV